MSWRVAGSIAALQAELGVLWPERSKESDGTIGDAAHASRDSDHNPRSYLGSEDVVLAFDITNDPEAGPDLWALARTLQDDLRCAYVIWQRKIYYPGGAVLDYDGENPHVSHLHLSVVREMVLFDDRQTWIDPWANVPGLQGDDVPYRNWPIEDRNKLLDDITHFALPHLEVPRFNGGVEYLVPALTRLSRIEATLGDLKAMLEGIIGVVEPPPEIAARVDQRVDAARQAGVTTRGPAVSAGAQVEDDAEQR